jgi:hypothetical protein
MLERRIAASAYLFLPIDRWPTPDGSVAQEGETPETWQLRREKLKEQHCNGNGCGTPLAMAATLWYTPQTDDRPSKNHERNLGASVAQWPTPNAHDGCRPGADVNSTQHGNLSRDASTLATPKAEDAESAGRRHNRDVDDTLTAQSRHWATPAARDGRDGRASEETMNKNARPLNEQVETAWATLHCPREHDSDNSQSSYLDRQINSWLTPHGMRTKDHTGKQGAGGEFAEQACKITESFHQDPPRWKHGDRSLRLLRILLLHSADMTSGKEPYRRFLLNRIRWHRRAFSQPELKRKRLNSRFVGWLMGCLYPIERSGCERSVMESWYFRLRQLCEYFSTDLREPTLFDNVDE